MQRRQDSPHAPTDEALPRELGPADQGTTTSDPSAHPAHESPPLPALTVVDHAERRFVGAFGGLRGRPGSPPARHWPHRLRPHAARLRSRPRLAPPSLARGRLLRRPVLARPLPARHRPRQPQRDLGQRAAHHLDPAGARRRPARRRRASARAHPPPPSAPRARHPAIVGVGTGLGRVLREVEQVARHTTTVALIGETGVGKEVIAQAIHQLSGRPGPIVALNCGGVSDTLITSELFGHVRGAFTGADRRRSGLIETARGGTLFLDEVIDASPGLQALLLRLFESGEYRAVGSDHVERADVRFVIAAQPEIDERIATRRFRLDLWARLARWVIRVPPLRDRREDVGALAHHFAERYASTPVRFAPELMVALIRHDWPGNVRELQGVIERLVIAQRHRIAIDSELVLEPSILEQFVITPASTSTPRPPLAPTSTAAPSPASAATPAPSPRLTPRSAPRPSPDALRDALLERRGNVRATAQALGVGRKTLYRWLEAYGIDVTEIRAPDSFDSEGPDPDEPNGPDPRDIVA